MALLVSTTSVRPLPTLPTWDLRLQERKADLVQELRSAGLEANRCGMGRRSSIRIRTRGTTPNLPR